jgi:hypothetical protein
MEVTYVGYLVEDEKKEKFFEFVNKVCPDIKPEDDYFSEFGFTYDCDGYEIIAGNNDNAIESHYTFVGKRVGYLDVSVDEIKNSLEKFEKLIPENERILKIICGEEKFEGMDVDLDMIVSLEKRSEATKKIEKIINKISKNLEISKQAIKLYDSKENFYFTLSGNKMSWRDNLTLIGEIYTLLNYEFENCYSISIDDNNEDELKISFEVSQD